MEKLKVISSCCFLCLLPQSPHLLHSSSLLFLFRENRFLILFFFFWLLPLLHYESLYFIITRLWSYFIASPLCLHKFFLPLLAYKGEPGREFEQLRSVSMLQLVLELMNSRISGHFWPLNKQMQFVFFPSPH